MSPRVLACAALAACSGLSLAACSDEKSPAACAKSTDCPAGHTCEGKVCKLLCENNDTCPPGYVCSSGFCEEGASSSPEITSVSGDSTQACAGGVNCVRSGFVVSGNNLSDAVFELVGPSGSASTYAMSTVGSVSATQVQLRPTLPGGQTDLAPGVYLLTAANQAGSDQTNLQILRGEPGPGASVYVYNDSTTATEEPVSHDRMFVRVKGSATLPKSHKIDMARFESLCGDVDGCTLTLGATRFRALNAAGAATSFVIESPLQGGPCRFFYNPTNKHWSTSQSCSAIFGLFKDVNSDPAAQQWEFDRPYQIYEYSNVYGVDGSGGAGDPDTTTLIVLGFKGACYLAEAAADAAVTNGNGNFLADDSGAMGAGFYLVTGHPVWDAVYPKAAGETGQTSTFWPESDTNRACELTVED